MRRFVLAVAVGLVALGAAGFVVAAGDDEAESTEERVDPAIVVLEPGENLVGWVGNSRSVAQIKRLARGIESVEEWNPYTQRRVAAISVDAGKGYIITLGGEESASFRRPMTPVKGRLELKRGRNLVTWLGPDDWAIDRVVLGIGGALTRVQWDGGSYAPSRAKSTSSLPLVQRGDALWVEVSRSVNWLQPAGVMPTIKFAGDASQELKQEVRRDSVDVMEFFADEFAIQLDGSAHTVYVAADVESLIGLFEEDGIGTEGTRGTWYNAGGWATPRHIVLKLEQWDPEHDGNKHRDRDQVVGRYVLAHEYYHGIQYQMSSTNAAQWMVEGGADWIMARLRLKDEGTSLEKELSSNRIAAASHEAPPLHHTERKVNTWHYTLGALASHRLELRSGRQAIFEFWRALLPEPLGPRGRWKSNPPWQSVFEDVFGMTVDDFYEEFADWRGNLAPLAVRGRVLGPDGRGLPFVEVVGRSPRLSDDGYDWFDTITDRSGDFTLAVSEVGFAEVGVDLGDCEVYHSSTGLVANWGESDQLDTSSELSQKLVIRLTSDICAWQVEGLLLDADGNGIGGEWIYLGLGRSGGSSSIRTDADGSFAATVPFGGEYTLSMHLDSCWVYYREGESPSSRRDSTLIDLREQDASGIRFQLTEGLCSTAISGRLLDADGSGVGEVWIYARNEDNETAAAQTESDGSFRVTVVGEGVYRLEALMDGCRVYFRRGGAVPNETQATRINLDERSVSGVRFQLREGQCSRKISGQLIDADGGAIAAADVWAQKDGNNTWAKSSADGTFLITLPEAGDYQLRARIDGCTVYYRSAGVTGVSYQATPIRVTDQDVTGIVFRLSRSACTLRISGELLGADGSPRSGVWVSADGNAGNGGARTSAGGTFSFTVPGSGSYRVGAFVDGCWIYHGSRAPTTNWYSAKQFYVSKSDVTGIVFRLPEDPSSFCN